MHVHKLSSIKPGTQFNQPIQPSLLAQQVMSLSTMSKGSSKASTGGESSQSGTSAGGTSATSSGADSSSSAPAPNGPPTEEMIRGWISLELAKYMPGGPLSSSAASVQSSADIGDAGPSDPPAGPDPRFVADQGAVEAMVERALLAAAVSRTKPGTVSAGDIWAPNMPIVRRGTASVLSAGLQTTLPSANTYKGRPRIFGTRSDF